MKTYNEMAQSVFERRDVYEKEQQIKRKKRAKLTVSLACVALVAVVGVGIWQNYNTPVPEQELKDAIVPGIKDWYGPGEEEPTLNSGNSVGKENDFYKPTGQDNDALNPTDEEPQRVLVESFSYEGEDGSSTAYSYKAPEPGEYFFSYLLNMALEKYSETGIYRVRVDVFDSEGKITDEKEIEAVAEKLYGLGYTSAVEKTGRYATLTLHATESQLKNFKADDEYGYFFFLYCDM